MNPIVYDPPDVAWALDVLVVGVVVGDARVVLVVEVEEAGVAAAVLALVVPASELPLAEADVEVGLAALEVPPERVAVTVARWGWAAKVANTPTPASEPAATTPVTARLRRRRVSRRERVVMPQIWAGQPRAA